MPFIRSSQCPEDQIKTVSQAGSAQFFSRCKFIEFMRLRLQLQMQSQDLPQHTPLSFSHHHTAICITSSPLSSVMFPILTHSSPVKSTGTKRYKFCVKNMTKLEGSSDAPVPYNRVAVKKSHNLMEVYDYAENTAFIQNLSYRKYELRGFKRCIFQKWKRVNLWLSWALRFRKDDSSELYILLYPV